jgi:hypothetical protein
MAKVSDDDMALMGRLLGRGEAGEKGAARIAALLDALNESESKLDAAVAELALANNYVRNTVELESRLGERDREIAANRRYIGEHIETIKSLETRLQSCELERDKYRAALMADRGEEAANRIRDEDRAFCLAHQTYFDSDIGCSKCNVVERQTPIEKCAAAGFVGAQAVQSAIEETCPNCGKSGNDCCLNER